MVAITDTLVDPNVALGANNLHSVADGLHCALPSQVRNLQPAKRKHTPGTDFTYLVCTKRLIHQYTHFTSSVLCPLSSALINQGAGSLKPLVELDRVLYRMNDLVTAIERQQSDVAFLSADGGFVLLGRHFNECLDVTESACLKSA
ncbi:hypothetical protein D3C84_775320 [compost metagenome]